LINEGMVVAEVTLSTPSGAGAKYVPKAMVASIMWLGVNRL
jgi:hypothetical protein